jgi:hypothetical protein
MSVPATFFLGATQALDIDLLATGAPTYGVVTAGSNATSGGFLSSIVGATTGTLGLTGGGKPVITPDSVISLEWHGEERISDYPVENGGFASFNKVAVPYDLRIVMTCAGLNYVQTTLQPVTQLLNQALAGLGLAFGQPMSRDAFLSALDSMLDSTTLYDVITPDKVYKNVNLVSYSHAKKHDDGATMVVAELIFREVRTSVSANYGNSIASTSESAASNVSVGTVNGSSASTSQTSMFNANFTDWQNSLF